MKYLKKDYKFIRFEKSNKINKKYDAILENKKTKKLIRLPFGQKGMEQYRDSTPLKLYKSQDHLDNTRRKAFLDRFRKTKERQNWNKEFSPLMFSTLYLW